MRRLHRDARDGNNQHSGRGHSKKKKQQITLTIQEAIEERNRAKIAVKETRRARWAKAQYHRVKRKITTLHTIQGGEMARNHKKQKRFESSSRSKDPSRNPRRLLLLDKCNTEEEIINQLVASNRQRSSY
ncbi:hypothetical protein EVAR_5463_1 [Eumeta japonica]|uniref:Uncharacterized protein n=1 Tax=Eumeta variegata TaxID=151549 RepID=A0A4C1T8P9_EUMVA|nr:hypothetical protein EVAR_5463_1 [Eumeta japonica]